MSTEKTAAPKPISSLDIGWEEWSPAPRFGMRSKHLTRAAIGSENYRVGVAVEELAPGKQSSPAHYHIFEEEHVYIFEGALTVRLGDDRYDMKSGDYVCFPAGQKAGHCLINKSGAICRYVIVGERNPDEVVVYTDSRKVLVRALGRRAIFDLAATRGYWDGRTRVFRRVTSRRPMLWESRPSRPSSPIHRSLHMTWHGAMRVRLEVRGVVVARSISPRRPSDRIITSAC
jgi:uncharacterized cupin superfamily protein